MSQWLLVGLLVGELIVYVASLLALILWANRRQRQIQIEDGTYVAPSEMRARLLEQTDKISRANIYGAFGGTIFGGLAWIIILYCRTEDWLIAGLLPALALLLFATSTKACLRNPRNYYRILIRVLVVLGTVNLAVVNMRWKMILRLPPQYDRWADLSLWGMDFALLILFGCLILVFYLKDRNLRMMRQERKKNLTR